MTVPQIVAQVLQGLLVGTDVRGLRDTYKVRPYTVMYGECELDFVHRLLEEEGIFYFFPEFLDPETRPKEPEKQHGIVLCDGLHAYEPIEGDHDIELRATGSLSRPAESVIGLKRRARMRPGKVTLRDWNLEKPSLNMDVTSNIARFDGDSLAGPEFYEYPGKYELPNEGSKKARVIAESFIAATQTIVAKSDTARLMCGHTFRLVPDAAYSAQGLREETLYVVRMTHDYDRTKDHGAKLEVELEAIPADVLFRAPVVTPRPIVTNPLIGHVTGPEGADIHTDELGRVKVHFPWDRYQPQNDNVSHWIPVLQDNTGHSAAIPRVGWEVVVAFVDGDPDRPFVLGRVYNAEDVFPEPLPANKTKTALRSLSSPGRDGQNEIWIEDAAGRELMSIQAEKDQNVLVDNDKREKVGTTEENTVIKDEVIQIGANNTVTVTGPKIVTVDGNQSITVGGSRSRKVGTEDQTTVAGARSMKVGSSHLRRVGGFDNAGVKTGFSDTVGGVDVELSLKENATNAGAFQSLTVGGAVVEVAGQGKREKAERIRLETIGAKLITSVKKGFELNVSLGRKTTVGLNLVAQVKETLKAAAGTALKAVISGKADVTGSEGLTVKVGDSEVTLSSEGITVKSTNVEVTASGKNDLTSGKATYN
jgi:type VI secretion system secreted protein VgrG